MGHEPAHSGGSTSTPTILLLAGILVALVALIVVIAMQGAGGGEEAAAGDAERTSEGPRQLEVGESVSRQDVEARGGNPPTPSKAVDTTRVVQTYEPGRQYRSLLQVSINARGEHHDWGITANSYTQYVGEAQILRTIESNDGQTIVLVQEFERARSVSAWSRLTGLRIELPRGFQTVLDLSGMALTEGGLLPGWSEVGTHTANEIFENEAMLNVINQLETDSTAQLFAFVDSLEGKKMRITYVNGEGVTHIEPIRGSLNHEEQEMVMATAVISDAYVLPDLQSRPGDTWTIHGQDMLPVLDPSLRATVSGALTGRRGEDGGTRERPTAEVVLDRGVLDLHDADGSAATRARWAPRGRMTFDFHDGIVTHAEIDGEFRIQQRSTDHLIFEARWSVEPEYQVVYRNEVVR
ncbi:MAG: hypothetical protein WD534_17950 [Phycisphaeraceae bacterium]